jgi:hypothetical protein
MKPNTMIGLGGLIIVAIAISANAKPGSNDSAFVAGYYTGRLLMLVTGVWLLVKGIIRRYTRRASWRPTKTATEANAARCV